ncbi:MAG: hypothetical protein MJZ38_00855, partial [archaeon]|nr:hypothetical protein [archaeon]
MTTVAVVALLMLQLFLIIPQEPSAQAETDNGSVDLVLHTNRDYGTFGEDEDSLSIGNIKRFTLDGDCTPVSKVPGMVFVGWSLVSGYRDGSGKYCSADQSVIYFENDEVIVTPAVSQSYANDGTLNLYAVWGVPSFMCSNET